MNDNNLPQGILEGRRSARRFYREEPTPRHNQVEVVGPIDSGETTEVCSDCFVKDHVCPKAVGGKPGYEPSDHELRDE